jgi:cytochrome c oxidase subunit 2
MNFSVEMRSEKLPPFTATGVGLPMAYGHTHGPAVDAITWLGWGLGAISILVIAVIAVLILTGTLRTRRNVSTEPHHLAIRRDAGGMAWIYVGGAITTAVLAGSLVWTMLVTAQVTRQPGIPMMTIQVNASEWWWGLRYLDANPSRIFTTANEIHIPTGVPVRFELSSSDVIHSFWIPQLAGKMDVIPGQTNAMWMQADLPGTYRGQCAAFCGMQHAHMALSVVADSPQDFASWEERQLAESTLPEGETALSGKLIFQTHCAVCHTIRGVDPAGIAGPDLSHLMTRATIAAGLLTNTPENLARWIRDPESQKPGAHMPAQALTRTELMAVTSYLGTLD